MMNNTISQNSFNQYFNATKELVYLCKYPILSYPLEVLIELTNRCNLNCIYCYKKDILNKNTSELSIESLLTLFEELKTYPKFLLVLEGGEPFMHSKIFDILKLCNEYNIYTDIITNGTLFNDRNIAKLKEVYNKDLFEIQISLDGTSEANKMNRGIVDEKIINGIKKLNQIGIIPRVHSVITNKNYLGIVEFINYLNENVIISSLSLNSPFGKNNIHLKLNEENINYLSKELDLLRSTVNFKINFNLSFINKRCAEAKKTDMNFIKCTALRAKICINHVGDIYPCVFFENNENPIGNINNNSLLNIWNSEQANDFRKKLFESANKCKNCSYSLECVQNCKTQEFDL